MEDQQQTYYGLAVALALGLLIGIERGWKERGAGEGERVAGVRTYGLIGLLGGGTALVATQFGPLVFGLSFIGVAAVLTTVYVINLQRGSEDVGTTSLFTALLTFLFGAIAVMGEMALAAACAVVTVFLLNYKRLLHRWVGALEAEEIRAGIKLLLISVVLLPILPNEGYGPWGVLNPYAIWWMVVLIASISFVGYFAIKIAGARRGAVFTGLFGGLASSTALTLQFSRMARDDAALSPMLAMGILLASGTMFPRMALVSGVINSDLIRPLLVPAAVMTLLAYIPAIIYARTPVKGGHKPDSILKNPLELTTALGFGLLLALVMLLGKALQLWFGDAGVLTLAAASGVADVDAITLSLARMSQDDLVLRVAATGIVLAAVINSLVKGGMAIIIGGRSIGLRVALPLLVSAIGGLTTVFLLVW